MLVLLVIACSGVGLLLVRGEKGGLDAKALLGHYCRLWPTMDRCEPL